MVGDGVTLVRHCENLDSDIADLEPDADPVYCDFEEPQEDEESLN